MNKEVKTILKIAQMFSLPYGRESTVNTALGGSTYSGLKLVCFSLCKKINCYETQQLILGIGNAIW
jgi:hypothetical protein